MRHYTSIAALAIALLGGTAMIIAPTPAEAQVAIDIRIGTPPPPLPIYEQPLIPGPDYVWTPGYWAWDDYWGDFYWVPGTWVLAPRPGLLWTPAWWGWESGVYAFHAGYWGPHVGFYGGVPYGFGYTGSGYEGGFWRESHFVYNKSVTNVTNINVTNVYEKQVTVNQTVNRVSFNGGPGGIAARPTTEQVAAEREGHVSATPLQTQHIQQAHQTRSLFASANQGVPPVAATHEAGKLAGPGVKAASSATPRQSFVAHGGHGAPSGGPATTPEHVNTPHGAQAESSSGRHSAQASQSSASSASQAQAGHHGQAQTEHHAPPKTEEAAARAHPQHQAQTQADAAHEHKKPSGEHKKPENSGN
jgi:hypothetical protein